MAWEKIWWSKGCFQKIGGVEHEWAYKVAGWGWSKYWNDEKTLNYKKYNCLSK
jgi:hypothetical protein